MKPLIASVRPSSLWAATAPPAPAAVPLPPGEHRSDVLVVGAGFTGLATALAAAERGADVVLLEAAEIGSGGSGERGATGADARLLRGSREGPNSKD